MATHFYQACGLSIASDAPIPGLCPSHSDLSVDVAISMEGIVRTDDRELERGSVWYVSPERDASGRPEMTVETCQAGYRLVYGGDTSFLIERSGRHIVARWAAAVTDVDAASYLAGSVLAFVLRLRGSVPLHGSAVVIGGRARLFVGESWSGKSSIAAAFSTLGYPLLSDDIVRIDSSEHGLVAYPAHPRLQVWSDSAETLFGAANGLAVHSDSYRKHYLDVLDAGYRFQATPVPIEVVYLLGDRIAECRRPIIEPLSARDALMVLVRHTYGNCLLDAAMRVREFDLLGRLVEEVLVRELRFGDDLRYLMSSCRMLADQPA